LWFQEITLLGFVFHVPEAPPRPGVQPISSYIPLRAAVRKDGTAPARSVEELGSIANCTQRRWSRALVNTRWQTRAALQ
jgi:hypothetical protein